MPAMVSICCGRRWYCRLMGKLLESLGKLTPCRACGNPISTEAQACPRCGAPPKSRRGAVIFFVLSMAFLLIIVGAVRAADRAVEATSEPAAAEQRPDPPAPAAAPRQATVYVSADQLFKDYEANEVSADERYRGKVLVVTGKVTGVKKGILDDPYIELATSGPYQSVWAHFPEERAGSLRALARGARITVRCIGDNVTIGMPQLKDCVLQ